MSNFGLQEFKAAFDVTFPIEIAEMILCELETTYGAMFGEMYGNTDSDLLILQVRKIFNSVTPQDLKTGLNRAYSEKRCPTLPELRSWCVSDAWWTANEAWARAMQYVDYPKTTKITELTKQALDTVQLILSNEGQKNASFAFRDIYNRLLIDAKNNGLSQVYYDEKNEKAKQKENLKKLSMLTLMTPHQRFSEEEQAIFIREKNLIDGGMEPRLAHQAAMKEYYALKGESFGPTNKVKTLDKPKTSNITPYHRLIQSGMDPVQAFVTIGKSRA